MVKKILNKFPTVALSSTKQNKDILSIAKQCHEVLTNHGSKVLFDEKPAKAREIARLVTEKLRKNDKMIFSVQTHARTKYSDYIRVLDQLKIAKAKRISIANPE